MTSKLKPILAPFASLKLTVTLLALSMLLIFAGTWAQIDAGIWQVQQRYFHSFFTRIDFQLFLPRPDPGQPRFPGGIPMIGGYTVIALLLINLIAAHSLRFKGKWQDLLLIPLFIASLCLPWYWPDHFSRIGFWVVMGLFSLVFVAGVALLHRKRTGIILIHLGLLTLLLGELLTSLWAVESQMFIDEGSSSAYSQSVRETELAVIDPSDPKQDSVTVIPRSILKQGETIADARLPFEVKVEEYHQNSDVTDAGHRHGDEVHEGRATKGAGVGLAIEPRRPYTGAGDEAERVDTASAYVTLRKGATELGTYLVSQWFGSPQRVEVDGKTYQIALRAKRYYKPYAIELLRFDHDKYLGTEVAKNFSSRIRLRDPEQGTDREILIKMNSPLRYRGETFFQARFTPITPDHPWETTILQVVENPGWLLPYVACVIGAAGLLVHFGIVLANFLTRRYAPASDTVGAAAAARKARPVIESAGGPSGWAGWAVPGAIALVCLCYVISAAMRPDKPRAPYDLQTFAKLPITHSGRTQPLDSLAINSLRILSGKSQVRIENDKGELERKLPAIQWLADVFAGNKAADSYKVFRIDYPDVKTLLDLKTEDKYFSANQILALDRSPEERQARLEKLQEHTTKAGRIAKKDRDPYQQKLSELAQHLDVFVKLRQWESLYIVPPSEAGGQWQTLIEAVRTLERSGGSAGMSPAAKSFVSALDAYMKEDAATFNREASSYQQAVGQVLPTETRKAGFEVFFNRFAPFYVCMVLYVLVFALACLSWLAWTRPLWRSAFIVLLLTLAVHSFGLIARMYISGRPPITNLYSSAVFVAWGAVLLAVFLELVFRNGLGCVAAAISGFVSLLIAHHLSGKGDTMEMLQAVLDTNIWLATHVVIINLGYCAAAIAGVLGMLYVIVGVFTTDLDSGASKTIMRMIYGSVCFAILFSFIGTILGGIWADQSWGRFWGWDPKENGAAMVVLWNAVILHARWGGIARERGIACLAIFGNVMLAWSWFGTNMLGVGLHSYGFMESAVFWLFVFVGSQLLLIGIGMIPQRFWRSANVLGPSAFPVVPAARGNASNEAPRGVANPTPV